MIRTVLLASAAIFIIGLIISWFVTGGVADTVRSAKNLTNPVEWFLGGDMVGGSIRLPWQPEITPVPIQGYEAGVGDRSLSEQRAAIEALYGSTDIPESDARTFGNPSPYVGRIMFTDKNISENNPSSEYVVLTASGGTPVELAGWSLQSAISGVRMTIPSAAPIFMLGAINSLQPISLEPGASVIVTSGISPVGSSFRENICTGYLNELQSFTPRLTTSCPAPYEMLPITADNIKTYGDGCLDYVNNLEQCHFPSDIPKTLSPACRVFVADTFSYNGCVNTHRNESGFARSSWRAYLGFGANLWRNTHDVIRLLDERGQVVDVLTY